MTRRESRKNAFILIFQKSVNDLTLEEILDTKDEEIQTDDFCLGLLALTLEHLTEIDDAVKPHLKRWTLERLPRVSLAVLRISVAQLMFMLELPASVIINEAVEIAKEFGAEDEYSFINGALRNINAVVRPQE